MVEKKSVVFPKTTPGLCVPEYEVVGSRKSKHVGNYTIETSKYELRGMDAEVTDRPCERWLSAVKAIVKKGDTIVTEVFRSCSGRSFPFIVVTKNGIDYFWYAPTYATHSIIDLSTGKEVLSYDNGFCTAEYVISPDKLTMAITGCYWACPYETKFMDLTNFPSEIKELPIVKKNGERTYLDCPENLRWLSDTVCFGVDFYYYEDVETENCDQTSGKLLSTFDLYCNRNHAEEPRENDMELFAELFIALRDKDKIQVLENRNFEYERRIRLGYNEKDEHYDSNFTYKR